MAQEIWIRESKEDNSRSEITVEEVRKKLRNYYTNVDLALTVATEKAPANTAFAYYWPKTETVVVDPKTDAGPGSDIHEERQPVEEPAELKEGDRVTVVVGTSRTARLTKLMRRHSDMDLWRLILEDSGEPAELWVTASMKADTGDEVAPQFACPRCGEDHADKLEINDTEEPTSVHCLNCGTHYDLPGSKEPEPAKQTRYCPLQFGTDTLFRGRCLEEECTWWCSDQQCAILTLADGARVYSRTVEH